MKRFRVASAIIVVVLSLATGAQAALWERNVLPPIVVTPAPKPVIDPQLLNMSITVDSIGPLSSCVAGRPYTVNVKIVNGIKAKPVTLKDMRAFWKGGKSLPITVKKSSNFPTKVAKGATTTASMTLIFPEKAIGQEVKLVFSAERDGKIRKTETSVNIKPAYEISIYPERIIVVPGAQPNDVGLSIINQLETAFSGKIKFSAYKGIDVTPKEVESKIDSYGMEAYVIGVSAASDTAPGHYALFVDVAGKCQNWAAVDVPVTAKKAASRADAWKDAQILSIKREAKPSAVSVGTAKFSYDDSNLYVSVEVKDAKHFLAPDWKNRAKATPPSDSIVIAVDPLIDGAQSLKGGYKSDDRAFMAIGAEGGSVLLETASSSKEIEIKSADAIKFSRVDNKSTYEVAIPWSAIPAFKPKAGAMLALSILVKDSDGTKATQYEFGGGLIEKVDPRKFMPVLLAE